MGWIPESVIFRVSLAGLSSNESFASPTSSRLSSSSRSRFLRKVHASSNLSWVSRLMTPRVKCRAPTGLTALRGMGVERVAFGWVTSEVKREMEAWREGREDGVTRGMQRKWVNWGFGGISQILECHRWHRFKL